MAFRSTKLWSFLKNLKCSLNIFKIFLYQYGFFKSMKLKQSIDANGRPIPWYTYPAKEFLDQFDFSALRVFEFGCGNSSLWWAERVQKVVSVESSLEWRNTVAKSAKPNMEILLCETKAKYLQSLEELDEIFDIIIIDGLYRYDCIKPTIKKFSGNGLIIVDNADWHPDLLAELRQKLDLIQVDFAGFGPINNYTWVTTVLISRNFRFKTFASQPKFCLGGIKQIAPKE